MAHYFASHEGKSDSDTAGSLEKLRAERVILRNKNLVITNAAQLIDAMTAATPKNSATAKYSFKVIEEMPVLDRVPSHVRLAVTIKGIMKLHFVGIQEGCLKTKTISCLQCLQEASECEKCAKLSVFKSVERLQALLSLSGSEQSDDEEGDHHDEEGAEVNEIEEETDSGEETDEDNSGQEDCEDDEIHEGCFVWAPFGRRKYPAQIVSLASVPQHLHLQLTTQGSWSWSRHCEVGWRGGSQAGVPQWTDLVLFTLKN